MMIIVSAVKTWYLYAMSSRLVNVRLDPERLRKAKSLRASGVPISDIVREAIDRRYADLNQPPEDLDVESIIRRIDEQFPDLPNPPPSAYNVHDRREARGEIVRHLQAKHRRHVKAHQAATRKRIRKPKSTSKKK
jgi:hypothetical protein